MACGCSGSKRTEAITSNVANAMIADARRTAEEERDALVASAANAMSNASTTDQFTTRTE